MNRLGTSSERHLAGIDQRLASVPRLAIQLCPQDFSVIFGYRSRAEQAILVARGASHAPESAHCYRKAYDTQPYLGAGVDPYPRRGDSPAVVAQKLARFEVVARSQFEAADQLGIPLQWGNDWDVDGIPTGRDPDEKGWLQDLVHFQEPPAHRIEAARNRAVVRTAARARGELVIA